MLSGPQNSLNLTCSSDNCANVKLNKRFVHFVDT